MKNRDWFSLPSGPLRQAEKAAQALTRIRTAEHGAVEFVDGSGRHCFIGPSRVRHFFDPADDASRRAAMLGARSKLAALPDGIRAIIIPPGILALTADDHNFWILSDAVASYLHSREQAENYLRARDLPALCTNDLAEKDNANNDDPKS
jgi:hypothetical protein